MSAAPLRNITAESEHSHNMAAISHATSGAGGLLRAKPAAAAGPVYAPTTAAAAGPNVTGTVVPAHANLLQRSAGASTTGAVVMPTSGLGLLRSNNSTAGAAPLNPSAATDFGQAGAAKPARRVTLLRSNPATVAVVAAAANGQQQHAYQQPIYAQQQQQFSGLQQAQHYGYYAPHPGAAMPMPTGDDTRPQTPTVDGVGAAAPMVAVEEAPAVAHHSDMSFVSPAKPRATLYRPVARNFFVTPVKETTAAAGDDFIHGHMGGSHHATPHSTPAGKGRQNQQRGGANKHASAGAALLQRESFGIGNTPKANEKKAQQPQRGAGATSASVGSAVAPKAGAHATSGAAMASQNASRKLLIGDEDDHGHNHAAPTDVAAPYFYGAATNAVPAPAPAPTATRPPHQLNTNAAVYSPSPSANMAVAVGPAKDSSTPARTTRHFGLSATPTGSNGKYGSALRHGGSPANTSGYIYVELEGLLGQRTFAVAKSPEIAAIGTHVVFEGDRGEDMGRIVSVSVTPPTVGQMHSAKASVAGGASPSANSQYSGGGNSPLAMAGGESPNGAGGASPANSMAPVIPSAVLLRRGSDAEVAYWREDLVREAELAVAKCIDCICRHGLNLIIVNAVFQFDHKKLTFFYETELPRVDFRKILAELYNEFHCRIWMERVE